MKEVQVMEAMKQALQSIYIPPALLEQMKEHLKSICNGKAEYESSEFDALAKELKEIQRKKEKLFDMMLDDSVQSITQSMYDKKCKSFYKGNTKSQTISKAKPKPMKCSMLL